MLLAGGYRRSLLDCRCSWHAAAGIRHVRQALSVEKTAYVVEIGAWQAEPATTDPQRPTRLYGVEARLGGSVQS